jgi:hypothetical protein
MLSSPQHRIGVVTDLRGRGGECGLRGRRQRAAAGGERSGRRRSESDARAHATHDSATNVVPQRARRDATTLWKQLKYAIARARRCSLVYLRSLQPVVSSLDVS